MDVTTEDEEIDQTEFEEGTIVAKQAEKVQKKKQVNGFYDVREMGFDNN